eukprot:g12681.t1
MAAFTNFLWTAAKNVATAATGVLVPGAAPAPAGLEGEAGTSSGPQEPMQQGDRDVVSQEKGPTKEDAGRFLNRVSKYDKTDKLLVKAEFGDDTFAEFLDLVTPFSNQSEVIDVLTIAERARDLLRGSTELTLGFNAFLPADYKIELPGLKECDDYDYDDDDDDDDDDDGEYSSAEESVQEASKDSPVFQVVCLACAADDTVVQRGALEGCQKCRPLWITAEEYQKDAEAKMGRASEVVAPAAVEEGEQGQQLHYCDYHRETAAPGTTEVPEEEGEENGESGDGGSGGGNSQAEADPPHTEASSQLAVIGDDAGGTTGDGDEESEKEWETAGSLVGSSTAQDAVGSRRHAISMPLPLGEEKKDGGREEETGGHGLHEPPKHQAPKTVEAARVEPVVVPDMSSSPRGDEAAAHPEVAGAPRDDRLSRRRAVEAQPQQPKVEKKHQDTDHNHDHDHELEVARRSLNAMMAARLREEEAREKDLDDSAGEEPELLSAEMCDALEYMMMLDGQEPQTAKQGREPSDQTLAQQLMATVDTPRFTGDGDEDDSSPKDDQPESDRRQEHAGLPEQHRPHGSAPTPSPVSEQQQQQQQQQQLGKEGPPHSQVRDEMNRRRGQQPEGGDEKGEDRNQSKSLLWWQRENQRKPTSPPPLGSVGVATVGADAGKQALNDLQGGGGKERAGQATAKTVAQAGATAAVRLGESANPDTAAAAARAAPAYVEILSVPDGAGAGAEGCLDLKTRARDGGVRTVGEEGKSPKEKRNGPAEDEGKEGDGAEGIKKSGPSRAERRATDRERAKERAKAAKTKRLEQHLRNQKKNNPKLVEGQLLANAPQAPPAAPPEAKPKTNYPPQGSVVAEPAPANGDGGGVGEGGGGGRGRDGGGGGGGCGGGGGGSTLNGNQSAKGDDGDKACSAGSATNRLPPASALAGGFPANNKVTSRLAARSLIARAAAARPPAVEVAAEPAGPGAKAVPTPSSGATKSVTFAAPLSGSADGAPTPTQVSGNASKKPHGTEKAPSTAEKVDATTKGADAAAAASKADATAVGKIVAGVRGLSRFAKSSLGRNPVHPSAPASSFPSGRTAKTPPPLPSVGGYRNNSNSSSATSGVAAVALPHPPSGPASSPLSRGFRGGEGWTWPAVDAPGGYGSGGSVGAGNRGGAGDSDDCVRDPELKGKEVAPLEPLRRFSWIGRAAAVGRKVEHPWGSWKRWRQPEKWEMMVTKALARYSATPGYAADRKGIIEFINRLEDKELARLAEILQVPTGVDGVSSADEIVWKLESKILSMNPTSFSCFTSHLKMFLVPNRTHKK